MLNLQRAIQLTIDIAFHIIAEDKLRLPENLKDSFRILKDNKIIPSELAMKMEKMVGFRNIAVLDYQSINPIILQKIIDHHLGDIENFYSDILIHFKPKIV